MNESPRGEGEEEEEIAKERNRANVTAKKKTERSICLNGWIDGGQWWCWFACRIELMFS
jgi:hypothetical protein